MTRKFFGAAVENLGHAKVNDSPKAQTGPNRATTQADYVGYLSRLIHELPEPVLLVERGIVVVANLAASRLFRRPSLEIVGRPLNALVEDGPDKLKHYLCECARKSEGLLGGLHIRRANHQTISCMVVGGLVQRQEQRGLVLLRLFPRDLANLSSAAQTEQQTLNKEGRVRQQDEQRWRTAFENSAIGITMAAFSGHFLAANSVFQNMLGYTESELQGLTFLDITYEEDRQTNLELVNELIEGKRQHFEIDKRYRRKDGTLVWARANVSLVPGTDGVAPFWFGIVEDITARKEAEHALQMTRAELARVSRLTTLGELAASIAHEVNQPLTAVTNNSNACLRLLADGKLKPETLRQALEEIVANGARASAVIARIRAFIRKAPAEKSELDINELIEEVLALTGHELYKNRVQVERQLTKPLPHVVGDRVQLQQVLLNLIVNGIEAMSTVTTELRLLRVQSQFDESGNVLVAVSDSGTGLGLEADRIFTPFYTTKAHGLGMGLSISRSLVEDHRGQLWATPNAPHGAVFHFKLPIATRSRS
jgi:PAS domain S-box-containing protein